MRKILLLIFLCGALSAVADERGEKRLERISRNYSAMGNYSISFVLRAGGAEQKGDLSVNGNNSYMRVADTEVFVEDSLRYEVRANAKEIVIDRSDAYEKGLLNPLNGFASVAKEFNVEECDVDGRIAVRLTPKASGEVVYIVTAVDGESIARIQYGVGDNKAEVEVLRTKKGGESCPRFQKECYKGFELIDFR